MHAYIYMYIPTNTYILYIYTYNIHMYIICIHTSICIYPQTHTLYIYNLLRVSFLFAKYRNVLILLALLVQKYI